MWSTTFFILSLVFSVYAATAEEWRGRSIYQLFTDRFALPAGSPTDQCNPADQLYCGGTWNAIREHLDYIQNAGFTAIWISPVTQAIDDMTEYGQSYHGYWAADIAKLNDHFGTSDDLKALSADLHRRDMYLMVDVVINNVAALSTRPDYSRYMFKNASFYHRYCPIEWGDPVSERNCWMGDETVTLPDLDTTNPTVASRLGEWVHDLVQEYGIDGLRVDAAKHVNMDFLPRFCEQAGVFCMGEVFSGIDVDEVASYQGPEGLDSLLNFPMRAALFEAFRIPGPNNVSAIDITMKESKAKFKDVGLLGNFIENHDLPRWRNVSVDIQTLFNAMTFNFMSDGIPIVYYGQEQGFVGAGDPMNREPLWPSQYHNSSTYQLISALNHFRNFLISQPDLNWLSSETSLITTSPYGIAIFKGHAISVLTTIGSPPQAGASIAVATPYEPSSPLINIFTCQQWVVGSHGMIEVEYTKGGVPVVLVPSLILHRSRICGDIIDHILNGSVAEPLEPESSGFSLSSALNALRLVFPAVVLCLLFL